MVHGRVPGDDDDTVAHIVVPPGSDRSAWDIFVEEVLYDGNVMDAEEYMREYKESGCFPEGYLPSDWDVRDPMKGETTWDAWAYELDVREVAAPPL